MKPPRIVSVLFALLFKLSHTVFSLHHCTRCNAFLKVKSSIDIKKLRASKTKNSTPNVY